MNLKYYPEKILNHLIVYKLSSFLSFQKANYVKSMNFVLYYVRKHLAWANVPIELHILNSCVRLNKSVFIYWRQRVENAPNIVKK